MATKKSKTTKTSKKKTTTTSKKASTKSKSLDVVTSDSKPKKTAKKSPKKNLTLDSVAKPKKSSAKTKKATKTPEEITVHVEPEKPEVEITFISEGERYEQELNEAFPEDALPEDFPPVYEETPEPEAPETYSHHEYREQYDLDSYVPEESIRAPQVETLELDEAEIEEEERMRKQPEKPKKPAKTAVKIVSAVLVLASAASVGFLIYNISRSNLLPAKYFYPSVFILAALMLLLLKFTIRRKTRLPAHLGIDFLSLVILGVSLFASLKLSDTLSFLDKNLNKDSYQTLTYNVVTGKESKYSSLDELKNLTITAPPDFSVENSELEKAVTEQAGAKLAFEENLSTVTELPVKDSDALILLGDSIYASMIEAHEEYGSQTKSIGNITLEIKVEKTKEDTTKSITDNSFLIYLSGIDTRSGTMPYASLSDVNMAIAVNPKTHKILLVSVPRDYYVQLHGTTGLHDKLTHAGSLGGVSLSMATLTDLLGVNFDRYIRVNFNFIIGLVDAVGGITVYSDVDYSFTTHTDSSCSFNPGNNFVYGKCALAFARERYAYSTGDRHRGENQEQVIEKVVDKLTSSTTLLTRYSEILNALDGTFETSLSGDDIQSIVRFQLDKMPSWKIATQNLDGTTGMDYTYSYPSQPLSVMYENPESITKAKEKLTEVLSEE